MVPPLGCRQAVQDLAHVPAASIHPPGPQLPAGAAILSQFLAADLDIGAGTSLRAEFPLPR
jgi:hypothetical protein